MKILFLSQVFPDDSAPARGTFNLALCEALSEEHKVRIIAPRPWTESLPRRLRGQGRISGAVTLDRTTLQASYPSFWYLPKIALHHTAGAMARGCRRAVREITRDFQPDAVLSYWADPEGHVGLEIARELGVPAACIVGGTDVLILPHRSRRRMQQVVRVLQESDAIITVSEGLRHACINLGAPPQQVRTIYQGINRSRFFPRDKAEARKQLRIPPGATAFVWVGRLMYLKRVDLLLEAARIVHNGGRRFKLYLLGDGPQRAELQAYAETLGLANAVEFVGTVAQTDLPAWYSAADATLLSSDSEGLPNVLRESLACGTPFVSTDIGSVGEFASPDFSLLVPPRDAVALARAMQAITQPQYRVAAGLYRSRSWRECADEIADLLAWLGRESTPPDDLDAAPPREEVLERLWSEKLSDSGPMTIKIGAAANRPPAERPAPETASSASHGSVDDFMSALNESLVASGPADRRRR